MFPLLEIKTLHLAGVLLGVGLFTLPLVGLSNLEAQESREGNRVLHRHLEPDRYSRSAGRDTSSISPNGAGDPQELTGLPSRGGTGLNPGPDEWVFTAQGPVGPDALAAPHGPLEGGPVELDEDTDQVDALNYQSNFEPSVVPLKRGVSQNRVRRQGGGTYQTFLEPGTYREIPVDGGSLRGDEEVFLGSFLVSVEPGGRISIPSVAPNQRILEVQTEPEVSLRFFADEADNFSFQADYRGLLRVEMEVAVPVTYFRGEFHNSHGWEFFPGPGELLSRETQTVATTVLEEMGISREEMTPKEALFALISHYRNFEGRPFTERRGRDRYVEISRAQVGVCRHRSLTFMISAMAMGFETRYIYNEAHAFVEVQWPELGWRRIDLGGAADQFNYQNQGSGAIHDEGPDTLPRPPAFEEEMARIEGQNTERDEEFHSSSFEEGIDPDLPAPQELTEADLESRSQDVTQINAQQGEVSLREEQVFWEVEVLGASGEVYRGQSLAVRGLARAEGSMEDWKVRIYLQSLRRDEEKIFLGEAEVGAAGRFQGEWIVPQQVGLGRWRLVGEVFFPE